MSFSSTRWQVERRAARSAHGGSHLFMQRQEENWGDDELIETTYEDDDVDTTHPGAYAVSVAGQLGTEVGPMAWEEHEEMDDEGQHSLDCDADNYEVPREEVYSVEATDQSRGVLDGQLVVDDHEEAKPCYKRTHYILLILFTSIAGIVLGVVLSPQGSSMSDRKGDNSTPFGKDGCDLVPGGMMQDPFLQCRCGNGSIAEVSDSVRHAYHSLIKSPELGEHLAGEMEITSCNPTNIALVWIAIDISSGTVFSSGRKAVERFVLVLVYAATEGEGWKNQTRWLGRMTVCAWYGVECDAEGNVRSLFLPSNNIQGSIESRFGLLTALEKLDLSDNALTGSIPIELWSLPVIKEVRLSYNELTGRLPTQLAATLQQIDLVENYLTGPIPVLEGLTNLTELILGWNLLTGSFPADRLQQLGRLEILNFRHLKVRGTMSNSISALSSLKRLTLTGTTLSGTIPESIGSLAALEHLEIGSFDLTGTIPTTVGYLAKLTTLAVTNGFLSGPVPSELGQCSGLKRLHLAARRLAGTIPSELARCSNLERFHIVRTQLTGTMPFWLLDLTNLKEVSIACSPITTAPFPSTLCNQSVAILTDLSQTIPACDCCTVPDLSSCKQ